MDLRIDGEDTIRARLATRAEHFDLDVPSIVAVDADPPESATVAAALRDAEPWPDVERAARDLCEALDPDAEPHGDDPPSFGPMNGLDDERHLAGVLRDLGWQDAGDTLEDHHRTFIEAMEDDEGVRVPGAPRSVRHAEGPAHLASALVNGDDSGLDEAERRELDAVARRWDDWSAVDCHDHGDGTATYSLLREHPIA